MIVQKYTLLTDVSDINKSMNINTKKQTRQCVLIIEKCTLCDYYLTKNWSGYDNELDHEKECSV